VRINQENAKVRLLIQNLLQDDSNAVRLADTGGAEHREVLAHQILDVDLRRNRVVLLQYADWIEIGVAAIDDAQFAIGHQHRRFADDRIFRDAALLVSAARGRRVLPAAG
jgi:hypothetical protein